MSSYAGQLSAQQQQTQQQQISSSLSNRIATGEVDKLNGNNSAPTGIIICKTGDKQCCHEITEKHVKVVISPGTHDHGSSKVKLKNVVDYKWEVKHYQGHLIAVHIDGRHIAYVINVNNKVSRVEGMVRVVNAQTGLRTLIKGMSGEVLDLQFAHIEKQHILGSIDMNSLFVHKIDLIDGDLRATSIVKIEDPLSNYTPKFDKISWCPFVDVPGEDDEDSQLIVWARGSIAQCFNINVIVAEYGVGVIHPNMLTSGYLKVYDDLSIISWVALSPDGSTLGVGSIDGVIRFYQVYMHAKEPRCLHQWHPHNGQPVSSLFFLDNLTKNVSETYWKYAITGACNNTEFKLWDCSTWECLQTLTLSTENEDKKVPRFIAEIDRTSSYLVISSLENRTCYILQIINGTSNGVINKDFDNDGGTTTNTSTSSGSSSKSLFTRKSNIKGLVFIKSICEFPLSSGILSFSIADAAVRPYKCANESYMFEEFDDYDEENHTTCCVVVRMFIVQSKSMQECRILYQPSVPESADVRSTLSDDTLPERLTTSMLVNTSADGSGGSSTTEKTIINITSSTLLDALVKVGSAENTDKEDLPPKNDEANETTALEAFLGSYGAQKTVPSTTTSTVTVMPSNVGTELIDTRSHTSSPQSRGRSFQFVRPDSFNIDKKTTESVSSEVLSTILMLASAAGQSAPPAKPENINLLNLVNNKVIEDKEYQKMQLKQTIDAQKKFKTIDNNPMGNLMDNMASGGSSPSREVREIMSLQDYEKTSYCGEDLLEECLTKPESATIVSNLIEPDITSSKCHSTTTNWPKAPDVHKVTTKHSAELQNAANLMSQAVNASSWGNLSNSSIAPTLVGTNSISSGNLNSTGAECNENYTRLDRIIECMLAHTEKVDRIQSQLDSMQKQSPNISEMTHKLELHFSKLMDKYINLYEIEHIKRVATFEAERETLICQLRDSLMQVFDQYAVNQFPEVIAKVINKEIQCQLAPMVAAKIEKLQQKIEVDLSNKIDTVDGMLRENIMQVCNNKPLIETFGKSILAGVQGSLQATFIESMSNTLIPAYEKSSQNMFQQLHDAFSVGIKEFMEQFDSYLQQLQPMQDSTEEILNTFTGFRQHMDSILLKHRNTVTETMLETRKDVKSLEILLARQMQETLRTEVRRCFDNQATALRSQANTPAPQYDLKDTILLLLRQGQINAAFHQALLANDLSLVEFTLKNADHWAVFTPECCLEQKVLLSLIQQISADMSNHNDVKQRYLADAVLAINDRDPITREHAPKVFQELFRNCQTFLRNYPMNPHCSSVRMMLKALHSNAEQY